MDRTEDAAALTGASLSETTSYQTGGSLTTWPVPVSGGHPASIPLLEVGVEIRADPLIIKNQTWDLGQVGNHPPDVKEGVGKEGLG